MKTPYAILIGLTLIAAAIFFREPLTKPAHAWDDCATVSDVETAVNNEIIWLYNNLLPLFHQHY